MHHREHVAFAEEAIQHGGIVMTHFAPSWWSIAPAYVTSEVNSYCATDLEVLITRKCPTLWFIATFSPETIAGLVKRRWSATYRIRGHQPLSIAGAWLA